MLAIVSPFITTYLQYLWPNVTPFPFQIVSILRYKYSCCNFMNDQIFHHKPNGLILGYRYLPFFSH